MAETDSRRAEKADTSSRRDLPPTSTLGVVAGFMTATVGLLVLAGWQFDIAILKSPLPSAVSMKANTAAAFLLAGLALILLQRLSYTAKALVRLCAVMIAMVGFLSLCHHLFGWDLGINDILFREPPGAIATSYPGLMAPNTALNFTLLGFAFIVLSFQRFRGSFIVEFPLVFSLIISVIGFFGYITGLLELAGPAAYTKMAVHTAGTFTILCIGMIFTAYERQRSPITIEQKFLAGITAAATVIIFISLLSLSSIQSLLQAGEWVKHTQQVKNQLDLVFSHVLEVQSSGRGFILTGSDEYLIAREKASRELSALMDNLRFQIADNPRQQKSFASLEKLVEARVAFSDRLVSTRKTEGEAEARLLFATNRGKMLTDSIRVLAAQMIAEENRILQTHQKTEEDRVSQTQLIIYLGLVVQILLLVFIFLVVKRDVTGRRKAEEELRQLNEELDKRVRERTESLAKSEERYRSTLENLMEGCQIIDFDYRYLYLNDVAANQGHRTKEELLGRTMMEVYPGIENTQMFSELKRCMQERVPHRMENEFTLPDGSKGWFHLSIEPVLEGVFILSLDVTERKQAEEELKKLSSAVEQTADNVFITNRDGIIEYVNPAFEKLTGYTKQEALGKTPRMLKSGKQDQKYYEAMWKTILSGRVFRAELVNKKKNGELYFEEKCITPIIDPNENITHFVSTGKDTTERKLMEDVLRENERTLKEAQQLAHIGNWELDLRTNKLKWSDEIYRLFDLDPQSFGATYEAFLDAIHPDDRERVNQAYSNSVSNRTGYSIDHRLLMKDGSIKYVHEQGETFYDEEGHPVRSIGTVQDITERKQAEEKILKANRIYAVISQINQMIVRTSNKDELFREACRIAIDIGQFQMAWIGVVDERTKLVNPVVHSGVEDDYLAAIKKISISDVPEGRGPTGTAIREGKHFVCDDIENDPRVATWKDEALKHGYRSSIALPIKLFGKVFGAFSLYAPVSHFFDQEEIVLLDEVTNDISFALETIETEKRWHEGEEALRKSEERFRLISENVADLIAVLDLEGRRVYNSPSYKNILGDPNELLGTNSFQEIHPYDRDKIKAIFQETVRTGIGQRAEYRFMKKDGRIFHIESQGSVIRDKDGKITNVVVVSRDVTEKKSLEQQFLRAQRMESLGALASGVAHDINNVLGPITLSLALLRQKVTDEAAWKLIDMLESSASRGSGIVRQVLTFARGIEGERIELTLKHVIGEMENIIKETFPKSIQLRLDLQKDLWTVIGDPTHLHQVLLNLCVNARDAMPSGGTLTVSAQNITLDESYSRIHRDAKIGPYVLLSVSDTGIGMPPQVREKVFEPFFTTKPLGTGSGLGLSTTIGIVRSHGGFINVYSEVGKGTDFKVYFPATTASVSVKPEVEKVVLPMGSGELILVVDDEASIREITKATLEASGYTVVTANDGTEAVALYAQRRESVALVVCDMIMPYMDGAATVRALKKINTNVATIMVSGLASNQPVDEPGGSLFLQKPYTAEKLLRAIGELLKK